MRLWTTLSFQLVLLLLTSSAERKKMADLVFACQCFSRILSIAKAVNEKVVVL